MLVKREKPSERTKQFKESPIYGGLAAESVETEILIKLVLWQIFEPKYTPVKAALKSPKHNY